MGGRGPAWWFWHTLSRAFQLSLVSLWAGCSRYAPCPVDMSTAVSSLFLAAITCPSVLHVIYVFYCMYLSWRISPDMRSPLGSQQWPWNIRILIRDLTGLKVMRGTLIHLCDIAKICSCNLWCNFEWCIWVKQFDSSFPAQFWGLLCHPSVFVAIYLPRHPDSFGRIL